MSNRLIFNSIKQVFSSLGWLNVESMNDRKRIKLFQSSAKLMKKILTNIGTAMFELAITNIDDVNVITSSMLLSSLMYD